MKLNLFELLTIQSALECKLEQLADNSGRIKRYPQKGAALILRQLNAKVQKEIDSLTEADKVSKI